MRYKFACFQGYCPRSDEIENVGVKELADRLRADTPKETLTNIAEWEERNITFWTERHPLSTVFIYFLAALCSALFVTAIIPMFVIVDLQVRVLLSVASLTALTTGVVLSFTMIASVIHSNRKIPLKENFNNVFENSMPLDALLKNRLGVCRDFAKLTACLLLNIYPNGEIYLATAPSHAAAGIIVENRLYMVDQRLPLLTIDKWNDYRHLKKLMKLGEHSLEIRNPKDYLSAIHVEPQFETGTSDKLIQIISKNLNIPSKTDDGASPVQTVELQWKKGAILYEDAEMVNHSFLRLFRAKLASELIDIGRITKIKVDKDGDDLNFKIELLK